MTWLRLLALVRSKLKTFPAPIDVIAPEDSHEQRERTRLRGLCEIQRSTRENLVHFHQHQHKEKR